MSGDMDKWRTMRNIDLPYLKTGAFVTACILFAGAYYQWPLFSNNQNTYFLIGLARAGYGNLSADWLANQTDSVPVFSSIVSLVQSHGRHWMFYVLFCGLAAAYAASLSAVAVRLYSREFRLYQMVVFFALLTLLHCPWVVEAPAKFFPGLWRIAPIFQKRAALSTDGMAGQYILGPFLQPSAFGVFLITSVVCFLYKKEVLAVLCAVLSATLHPTYVLHAAILTAAYMVVLFTERRARKAIVVGTLAFLLILPTVLYVFFVLHPTNPSTLREAQAVLVETRIPHHAKASAWFSRRSFIQLAIMLAGLAAAYRSRRLFLIIALSMVAGIGLTLVQAASGNMGLALLFPWRLSAWLVPMSTAILLGGLSVIVTNIIDRFTPSRYVQRVQLYIVFLSFAFLALCFLTGVRRTISGASSDQYDYVALYAKAHSDRHQTYLVPLEYERFRLASGLPVFVDWKSHPYRDTEVLEWYERVRLAKAFYEAENPHDAVSALDSIRKRSLVTHVILKEGQEHLLEALHYRPLFKDGKYMVVEIGRDERVGESNALKGE